MTIEENVQFESDGLTLEGVLAYPERGRPEEAALVSSPHPHFAGDMDNNVVKAIALGLAEAGFAALRYNFRGVGTSGIGLGKGESAFDFWRAVEEKLDYGCAVADARAARDFLLAAVPLPAFHSVGYSFGGVVGMMAFVSDSRCRTLVAVSPPLNRVPMDFLSECAARKLLIVGENDFTYSSEALARARAVIHAPLDVELLSGTDHFFRGGERELVQKVRNKLARFAR